MEIEELSKFNEWWTAGRVSGRNLKEYKRHLIKQVFKFLPDRQALLLAGLRRVGKTVLMYQLIQYLLDRGVPPKHILYFSFDEERFDIKDVIETYRVEVLKKNFEDVERTYLFFDEVHKVEDWGNKIKVYYDLNPNLKFFLTGSAALNLSKKSKESLAGRSYEFVLPPLSFREFLEMKGIGVRYEDAELAGRKILPHFADFLRKAGFPEIADEENDEKICAYVRSSVVERAIYRDVPKEFGRVDLELLEALVNIFFKNPGMTLNFQNLSRDLGRNKRTVMSYVYYLRFSLLLNLVSNFRPSVLATSRKNRKAYPATPALTFSFLKGLAGETLGKALEAIFCAEAGAKYYFKKGKGEIDFLLGDGEEMVPVEIRTKISKGDLRDFAGLVEKAGCDVGLVLTYNEFGRSEAGGVRILVYPVWAFLLFKEKILKGLLDKQRGRGTGRGAE